MANERREERVRICRIISGGQTGVDRGALDAALDAGIGVGGWCPLGRRAEDGPIAERYPLKETPSEAYDQRTVWNVRDSDGTLVLVTSQAVGGTLLTIEEARRQEKPLLIRPEDDQDPRPVIEWIRQNRIECLNVAGARESESPGAQNRARRFVQRILEAAGIGTG